jgi:hypothetical protein
VISNFIIGALILFGVVALVIIADLEKSLENPPDHEAVEPGQGPTA